MAENPEVAKQFEKLKALQDEGNVRGMMDTLGELFKTVSRTFKPDDLTHSLQTLRGTIATLKADTDRCQGRFEEAFKSWLPDSKNQQVYALLQFELRQLIRTFFAEVEGTVYSLRQVILWAHERGEIELSIPETALLREEAYRFDSGTKRAKAITAFSSTLDSFLLTLTIVPRVFKSSASLNLSQYGWQAFRELLEVRNAVTHPKELLNLVVDAQVITKVLPAARTWYYKTLLAMVADPLLTGVLLNGLDEGASKSTR